MEALQRTRKSTVIPNTFSKRYIQNCFSGALLREVSAIAMVSLRNGHETVFPTEHVESCSSSLNNLLTAMKLNSLLLLKNAISIFLILNSVKMPTKD